MKSRPQGFLTENLTIDFSLSLLLEEFIRVGKADDNIHAIIQNAVLRHHAVLQ